MPTKRQVWQWIKKESALVANIVAAVALLASVCSVILSCRVDNYARSVAFVDHRVALISTARQNVTEISHLLSDVTKTREKFKAEMDPDQLIKITELHQTLTLKKNEIERRVRDLEKDWTEADPKDLAKQQLDIAALKTLIEESRRSYDDLKDEIDSCCSARKARAPAEAPQSTPVDPPLMQVVPKHRTSEPPPAVDVPAMEPAPSTPPRAPAGT